MFSSFFGCLFRSSSDKRLNNLINGHYKKKMRKSVFLGHYIFQQGREFRIFWAWRENELIKICHQKTKITFKNLTFLISFNSKKENDTKRKSHDEQKFEFTALVRL